MLLEPYVLSLTKPFLGNLELISSGRTEPATYEASKISSQLSQWGTSSGSSPLLSSFRSCHVGCRSFQCLAQLYDSTLPHRLQIFLLCFVLNWNIKVKKSWNASIDAKSASMDFEKCVNGFWKVRQWFWKVRQCMHWRTRDFLQIFGVYALTHHWRTRVRQCMHWRTIDALLKIIDALLCVNAKLTFYCCLLLTFLI